MPVARSVRGVTILRCISTGARCIVHVSLWHMRVLTSFLVRFIQDELPLDFDVARWSQEFLYVFESLPVEDEEAKLRLYRAVRDACGDEQTADMAV